MRQEQKDLLLKDLCARLPYDVKVSCNDKVYNFAGIHSFNICILSDDNENNEFTTAGINYIKPYLFPLSSMTEEQKKELREMEWSFDNSTICNIVECFGTYRAYVDHSCCSELVDWCIKNHFDYRGLIPMDLANDATGKNIY